MSTDPLHAVIQAGPPGAPLLALLHGVGSDERDLLPLGRQLLPGATIASLRAPFPGSAWGYGAGYAWYQFRPDMQPVAATLTAGAAALATALEVLWRRPGMDARRTVVAGFSQGAAMALHFALHHPGAVAGVVMWSGYLIDEAPPATHRAPLSVFWGHGTTDPIVPFEWARSGWAALGAAGASLESREYRGMPHTVWPAEIDDTREWLRGRLEQE